MHRRQSTIGGRNACRPTGRRVLTPLLSLFVGTLRLFLFPGISRAATPPGTQITNIVSVFYEVSPVSLARSNSTAVTVDWFNAVSIGPPWSGPIYPGTSAVVHHTVTNAGNVTDTIDLEGSSSLGLSFQFLAADGQTLLGDGNGNGKPDVGPLPPGGSIGIVIRFTVRGSIARGQIDNTTIT